MIVKPRHPDCRECKFFSSTRIHPRCVPCGAGEFFEEKFDDSAPDENELMLMFLGMNGEYFDDDE